MANPRIALYVGNEMYPGDDPDATIPVLQASPLTSPILGLVNHLGESSDQLVYNDPSNAIFDKSGAYVGSGDWPAILRKLRGGNVRELYLSFSTNGTEYMADLIASDRGAAMKIFAHVKGTLGFDGIDLDYEHFDFSPTSPIYPVADAAVEAGLNVTAAPFTARDGWQAWVRHVQGKGGTVAWLNLQCYAGGIMNNPGDWLSLGVPIVAGSCNQCGGPPTNCTPADMQALFTLWTTGKGSVPSGCWDGTANTGPQAIGGGFIWVYSSVKGSDFDAYMNAVKTGLGA